MKGKFFGGNSRNNGVYDGNISKKGSDKHNMYMMHCTCDQYYHYDNDGAPIWKGQQQQEQEQQRNDQLFRHQVSSPLDASFVHLSSPLPPLMEESLLSAKATMVSSSGKNQSTKQQQQQQQQQQKQLKKQRGIFEGKKSSYPSGTNKNNKNTSKNYATTHKHLQELLKATQLQQHNLDGIVDEETIDMGLCVHCIERVQSALDSDTTRLEKECIMYEQTLKDEEESYRRIQNIIKQQSKSISAIVDSTSDSSNSEWSNNNSSNTAVNNGTISHDHMIQQSFYNEISMLEESILEYENEIQYLQSMVQQQHTTSKELDEIEYNIEVEKNCLELEARAFNNDLEQYHLSLCDIRNDIDLLSYSAAVTTTNNMNNIAKDNSSGSDYVTSLNNMNNSIQLSNILSTFRLSVDRERGLRYPLINELRLVYMPKNDINYKEISVAWSLCAQLVLCIGAIFQFESQHWKIIPLSHGAKIMFYHQYPNTNTNTNNVAMKQQQQNRIVYQLGHPKAKNNHALIAWNALLYQIILHVIERIQQAVQKGVVASSSTTKAINTTMTSPTTKLNNNNDIMQMEIPSPFPQLPYRISSKSIGTIQLNQLTERDDIYWSKAIHCMSSNLLWLSECAVIYLSQQVDFETSIACNSTGDSGNDRCE